MEEFDREVDFSRSPYEIFHNHKVFTLSDIGLKKYFLSKRNIITHNKRFTVMDLNKDSSINSVSLALQSNTPQPEIKVHRDNKVTKPVIKQNLRSKMIDKSLKLKKINSTDAFSNKLPFQKQIQSERRMKLRKHALCYPNTRLPNSKSSSNVFNMINTNLLKTFYSGCSQREAVTNCKEMDNRTYYDMLSNENERLRKTIFDSKDEHYLLSTRLPRIHMSKRIILANLPSRSLMP